MMQGKLIVLEGVDGSGKSTQYEKLCSRLEAENRPFVKLVFPRYDKESSALIRMYLKGGFGSSPNDVNPYAASTFFAVDRYASHKEEWGAHYSSGGLVLCDRYTTSNAVHQGSKLPDDKLGGFLEWLYDFEFRLLGLPRPDLVLYMDVDADCCISGLKHRQTVTNTEGDIHETDIDYLKNCLRAGSRAADVLGWKKIKCVKGGLMRNVDEIHLEVYDEVERMV
ncbi:MAG: thymidylate kinase [Oscillospiraceae bacterium]|nr:thymidylate kinase [Oscillospiraceae bacterium]